MRRRAQRLMGGGRVVLWDSFVDTTGTEVIAHASDSGAVYSRPDGVGYSGRGVIDTNRARPPQAATNETLFIKSRLRRRNVRMSCDFVRTAAGSSSTIGFVVRTKEMANGNTPRWGYQVLHVSSSNVWQIVKLAGGQIGSNVVQALTNGQTYRVDLQVRGPVFILSVDGTVILQGEDTFTTKDGIGLRFVGSAAAQVLTIDNWMVTR